ncbi:hypothetical protein DVU_1734 [Nitratidesulfovibrio vulgaris str. Hildenborough]|uniref:Uncharacterized protein n=1 Tax=Nitratidesulfovibrio vulgaris (strain ATCC 29579 / DSM 644 / CCUG 34227 / NCIMB 8303 / VKM B-1760 / Hildenborough) TaxID=882 RepID=Q72BA2_NITV2|nr:hypothetical protein DVU_1734 [Nitratidesulfovibrio vulgaris str. Hildenborough]
MLTKYGVGDSGVEKCSDLVGCMAGRPGKEAPQYKCVSLLFGNRPKSRCQGLPHRIHIC